MYVKFNYVKKNGEVSENRKVFPIYWTKAQPELFGIDLTSKDDSVIRKAVKELAEVQEEYKRKLSIIQDKYDLEVKRFLNDGIDGFKWEIV